MAKEQGAYLLQDVEVELALARNCDADEEATKDTIVDMLAAASFDCGQVTYGCTPITSVKKALANWNSRTMVRKRVVGPFSMDPVLRAMYRSAIRPGKITTRAHATVTKRM